MDNIIIILVLSAIVVLLSLAGLGIKTLLHRGELKRHCAGRDPYSGRRNGCACAERFDLCADRKAHPYQPLDVNENLLKEL